MSNCMFCIFFVILLYSSSVNFVRYMHMFQLNSYHASEQFKWISENKGEVIKRHILSVAAAVFAFLSCFVTDGGIFGADLTEMSFGACSWDFIICTILTAIGLLFCKNKPAKKKLVFTPRVIRMCVTSAVVYGLVCALSIIFLSDFKLTLPLLCLLQVFSLFMPMLSNFINKPIEKGINNYYIKDAEHIIDSLPNLITIGITGSYGKTSAKFYLNKLLSAKYNVIMTPESFNTTMGVVKTIRNSLNATYDFFICEMGAKGVGEIKEICDIVKPKHSMITSIGEQHLETFKSVENIIKTKFEIADCITDGIVFLNYDNEYIKNKPIDKNVVSYGLSHDADYYADNISVTVKGTSFTVHHGEEEGEFFTKLIGEHNVQNIVGAIAAANTLGVSFAELKMPVRRLEAVPHRMEIIDRGGNIIIDDAFNSNPAGAKAALDAMSLMDGYKILITPGMVELGEKEYELNKAFAIHAAKVCDYVIAVGVKQAQAITDGLKEAEYPEEKSYVARDLNEALAKADTLRTGGAVKILLLENDLPDNY